MSYEEIKLLMGQMLPGQWLDFAWDHGNAMSYYIRTEPEPGERAQIIVQSKKTPANDGGGR